MTWDWSLLENLTNPGTNLGALALALMMIALTWAACALTTRIIQRPHRFMERFDWKLDETVIRFILRFKNVVICLVAGLVYASLIPGLRALVGTLMAGAGITALVVGFAAKSTLANLVAGFSLAIYRPFRIGDKVSIENEYGTVEDITLRHTIVRTWEYKRLILPNENIDRMTLINYSIVDPRILCRVEMGVSYDTDIDLARRLIVEEAMRCPYRDPEGEEDPCVRVISHGDFAIGLRIYVWTKDVDDAWLTRFWLFENVKKRFDREGVEIPFPYRTVVYKKDLPPPPRETLTSPEQEFPVPKASGE
jgi:small-conductance mechanosensitive channel